MEILGSTNQSRYILFHVVVRFKGFSLANQLVHRRKKAVPGEMKVRTGKEKPVAVLGEKLNSCPKG